MKLTNPLFTKASAEHKLVIDKKLMQFANKKQKCPMLQKISDLNHQIEGLQNSIKEMHSIGMEKLHNIKYQLELGFNE